MIIVPQENPPSLKTKHTTFLKHKITSTLRKASSKPKWSSQPHCAFLKLPGELRNEIYHLVLIRNKEHEIDDKNGDELSIVPSPRLELRSLKRPALTATCRQIQFEALSYFFRHETFSYTFVLDGSAKLSYKVQRQTQNWLQAANIKHLTIHDLSFDAQLPDVEGPYDSNEIPMFTETVGLITVKGKTLEVVEREMDDESVDSAATLRRKEKLLVEMEKIVQCGVDLENARKIAKLILRIGGYRFRFMLIYIRGLCLVRDKISSRLANWLAMAPIIGV